MRLELNLLPRLLQQSNSDRQRIPSGFYASLFRTGDRGSADAKTGAIAIHSRFKEIFKVRYKEVSLAEVEGELLGHGDIADALVTATKARDDARIREYMA
ncbi:AMP-dependent synthetase/ligase [Cordyceps fumosorosea ARSEF 2679]|uniref:AMP-dependent synthetase/ligase n=1 Tax=Cordyceps fumosorosea (strain ARSEF 2679) TaxID=1081104 RepID=A0A166VW74_CORFA|nr:AMP-dependent synthetase/ligase [Cordyceps fumosorosea ARSEF 2679]OAA34096.1 AMP-dependent synthetase/ligase [Cordyceps fumosorosea ARSEF 2679]